MPFYKDTPQNRRLGRVGKPYGKAAKPQRKPKKPFDYDPTADLERYYRAVEASKKPKTQLADLGGVGDMADIMKFLNPDDAKQLALTSKEMNRMVQKQPAGTFKRQPRKIKFDEATFLFDDDGRDKLSNWKSLGLKSKELKEIKKAIQSGEDFFTVLAPEEPYMFYLLDVNGTRMLIQKPYMKALNDILPYYIEWADEEPVEYTDKELADLIVRTNPEYKEGLLFDQFLNAIGSPDAKHQKSKSKPKPKPKPKKPLDMEGVD